MYSKRIVISLVLILLMSNFISWLLWGRGLSLEIAASEFQTNGSSFADTIHVFKGEGEPLAWYLRQYPEYSNYAKRLFEDRLSLKTNKLMLHEEGFNEYDNVIKGWLTGDNCIYDVFIFDIVPFYVSISKSTLAGGASVEFRSSHIWFFHWWQIDNKLVSES